MTRVPALGTTCTLAQVTRGSAQEPARRGGVAARRRAEAPERERAGASGAGVKASRSTTRRRPDESRGTQRTTKAEQPEKTARVRARQVRSRAGVRERSTEVERRRPERERDPAPPRRRRASRVPDGAAEGRLHVEGGLGDDATRRERLSEGSQYLLDVLASRRAVRRIIGAVTLLLAVAGAGMLAYPFATNLYTRRVQQQLVDDLFTPELRGQYADGRVEVGDSLTRISIPSIKVKTVVVEGTTANALRAGAGHYVDTPLPGETGNVAIAGHRMTFGKPFGNLDRVREGDEVTLETPLGMNHYRVVKAPYVVDATDWSPIAQTPGKTLTLTTCHPRGSDRQRLIVKAEFVRFVARSDAGEGAA